MSKYAQKIQIQEPQQERPIVVRKLPHRWVHSDRYMDVGYDAGSGHAWELLSKQ